jgi:hypothetical protein
MCTCPNAVNFNIPVSEENPEFSVCSSFYFSNVLHSNVFTIKQLLLAMFPGMGKAFNLTVSLVKFPQEGLWTDFST